MKSAAIRNARSAFQMKGHGVRVALRGRTERIGLGYRHKAAANGVLLDVPHAAQKLLFAHNLALIETAHPHIQLALQTEGESPLMNCMAFSSETS